MSSPFPGMDPFLEGDEWPGFHVSYVVELQHALAPRVQPKYIVLAERRIYLERHLGDDEPQPIIPDVTVVHSGASTSPGPSNAEPSESLRPVFVTLPMPEEEQQTYLTIRQRESRQIVTVIEVLSPANKRRGGDGRREYLEKRGGILKSPQHLVEIDLLRGGARLPTVEALPQADFFVFVSRASQRPQAEVFPWHLRDKMPTVPIPLLREDGDVRLDLQAVFDETYERTGYAHSLDYRAVPSPALSEVDSIWVRETLSAHGL